MWFASHARCSKDLGFIPLHIFKEVAVVDCGSHHVADLEKLAVSIEATVAVSLEKDPDLGEFASAPRRLISFTVKCMHRSIIGISRTLCRWCEDFFHLLYIDLEASCAS